MASTPQVDVSSRQVVNTRRNSHSTLALQPCCLLDKALLGRLLVRSQGEGHSGDRGSLCPRSGLHTPSTR